jgi:hypothetical protein
MEGAGRCANDVTFCAVGAACDVGSYAYLPYLHRMKFVPSKKYVRAGATLPARARDPQGWRKPTFRPTPRASAIGIPENCWAKLHVLGQYCGFHVQLTGGGLT